MHQFKATCTHIVRHFCQRPTQVAQHPVISPIQLRLLRFDNRDIACNTFMASVNALIDHEGLFRPCMRPEGPTCEAVLPRSSAMARMAPSRGSMPGKICLKRTLLGPLGSLPVLASYFPVNIPNPCSGTRHKSRVQLCNESATAQCTYSMQMRSSHVYRRNPLTQGGDRKAHQG